jgi:hypothetical protein
LLFRIIFLRDKTQMNRRFRFAMAVYAVLAILAGFTLTGDIRLLTWFILGAIAVKTWLVELRKRLD